MSMGAGDIITEGEYLLTQEQLHSTPVRSHAHLNGALTKVEFISPLEILAAAEAMITENGELDQDALTKAISEHFGFKRLGPALKSGIQDVIDQSK